MGTGRRPPRGGGPARLHFGRLLHAGRPGTRLGRRRFRRSAAGIRCHNPCHWSCSAGRARGSGARCQGGRDITAYAPPPPRTVTRQPNRQLPENASAELRDLARKAIAGDANAEYEIGTVFAQRRGRAAEL